MVTLPLVLLHRWSAASPCCSAFGRNGVLGRWLYESTGYSLPFTTTAVVVAETFVAMPFLVVSVEAALRVLDPRFDEAAATLGASSWYAFTRVTVPMIAPGIAAGAVLCWARALGEFGATITFAGAFPGRTQTMPIAVYLALQDNPEAAIALSLVLLVVSSPCWPASGNGGCEHDPRSPGGRPSRPDHRLTCRCTSRPGPFSPCSGPTAPERPRPYGRWPACCRWTAVGGPTDGHSRDVAAGVAFRRQRRSVVFQDYLLFPTMSARDNVAFGLRARGVDRVAAGAAADRLLARFGLSRTG